MVLIAGAVVLLVLIGCLVRAMCCGSAQKTNHRPFLTQSYANPMYVSPAIQQIRGSVVAQSNPLFGEDDDPASYRNSRDVAAMAYDAVGTPSHQTRTRTQRRMPRPESVMLDDFGFGEESVIDEFDLDPFGDGMSGVGDAVMSIDEAEGEERPASMSSLDGLPMAIVDQELF
jgi:hypothetical protein